MATIEVAFTWSAGVRRRAFTNARLEGSWDAAGRYSDAWSSRPMTEAVGEDGCPCFRATVRLDDSQLGWTFRWGVRIDGPGGQDLWAIPTEVRSRSTERVRSFVLARPTPEQRYWLTNLRRLGANKVERPGAAAPGIRFAVWAPNAEQVDVVMAAIWDGDPSQPGPGPFPRDQIHGGYLDANGQRAMPGQGPFRMTRDAEGVWSTDPADPRLASFASFDHRPYMYRIVRAGTGGAAAYRTDLYSRCQIGSGSRNPGGAAFGGTVQELDGTVSCSVVVDPERVTELFTEPVWPERRFVAAEEFWANELDAERPLPRRVEDLVIYELHVGALGFGKAGPGSLSDAIAFLDHLEALGVNAVELLPLSEFGGGGQNWGYATSHHFAIEYSGGGRDQYKWFVRECHRRGIAVILDVVYNHFAHDAERAEWMYDAEDHARNLYYWYEGSPSDYPAFDAAVPAQDRGKGGYVDNYSTAFAPRYHEEMVRKLFISSAVALVEEFHVDGFRVDQTTSIHAYNARHADGARVDDANVFGAKMLREWTRTLRLLRPDVMLMAEDHSNWDAVTRRDGDGLGFDARWYADFYHHLVGDKSDSGPQYARLLQTAGSGWDGALALDAFAGALAASADRKVVYYESHDEAGNSPGTRRTLVVASAAAPLLPATRHAAEARVRLAAGLTLLSAGTPMFLFGEEVGATQDFVYGHVLCNREDLQTLRASTGAGLFRCHADLIALRRGHGALRSRNLRVLHVHDQDRVLAFRRWEDGDDLLVLASFHNVPFGAGYRFSGLDLPDGSWREIFNSDGGVYGGDQVGNLGGTIRASGGSFEAVVPANGVVVFQRT